MKKVSEMSDSERFELSLNIRDKIKFCKNVLKTSDLSFIYDRTGVSGKLFDFSEYDRDPGMAKELRDLLEKISGTDKVYEQLDIVFTTDQAWNNERNKNLNGVYFTKHTQKPEYVQVVDDYFTNRLKELQATSDEMDRLENEWKAEREIKRDSMKVIILKNGSVDTGDGKDYFADVEITDGRDTLRFACRNIFDFGFVINPMYSIVKGRNPGGVRNDDSWQGFTPETGWTDVRELTEFEKKCLDYLSNFSPIETQIRM